MGYNRGDYFPFDFEPNGLNPMVLKEKEIYNAIVFH